MTLHHGSERHSYVIDVTLYGALNTVLSTSTALLACKETEFRCGDGLCIPREELCDGFRDCYDDSDEEQPNCFKGKCFILVVEKREK